MLLECIIGYLRRADGTAWSRRHDGLDDLISKLSMRNPKENLDETVSMTKYWNYHCVIKRKFQWIRLLEIDCLLIIRQPRDGPAGLISKLSFHNTKESFGESSFKESSFVSFANRRGGCQYLNPALKCLKKRLLK